MINNSKYIELDNIANLSKKELEKLKLQKAFKQLWRSVIKQALIDASSTSKKRSIIASKKRLKTWFNEENYDFVMACKLAGYEPEIIKYFYDKVKID